MRDLTDFDKALISAAKARRDKMLSENVPCCGTCQFGVSPSDSANADHYVLCQWAFHTPIPCHETAARLERLMSHISGVTCPTYCSRQSPRKEEVAP